MNPLSSHSIKPLSSSMLAAGGAAASSASHVTDLVQTRLTQLAAIQTSTTTIGATTFKEVTSTQEAIAACGLSAVGGAIAEDLSTKGVEDFYQIKVVPEKFFPRQKIDFPSEEIKKSLKSRPESIYRDSLSFSDPRQKTIAMPTDQGLMLLSAYYKNKYDVDIHVVGSADKLYEALLGEGFPKEQKTWGIIATNGKESMPHVTPIICNRLDDGTIQILNLDSVLNPVSILGDCLVDLKTSGQNVQIIRLEYERQADSFSCRTDALVILKDALQDLRANKVLDLSQYLTLEKSGKSFLCNLPPAWGKTVQVSEALTGADLSKPVVGKKGESVEAFRSKHKTTMQKQEKFSANYRNAEGYIDTEEISLESTVKINRFLNYKGKRNLELIKHLVSAHQDSLFATFESLKAFYK